MKERNGCLSFLGPIAKLLAIKDDRPNIRVVKSTEVTIDEEGKTSVDEIGVELMDDQPDEFANVIAKTFRTGKTQVGYFDEKTGEWVNKELD